MSKWPLRISCPHVCKNFLFRFGLPSLCKVDPDLETATIESMGALSSDDVGRLCEKFGFEEEVTAALTREVRLCYLLKTSPTLTRLCFSKSMALRYY